MTIFYLETSALAKVCKREKGSEVIEFLFAHRSLENRIVISFLSIIEFTGLMARLRRSKTLKDSEAAGILSRFNANCLSLDIAAMTSSILDGALSSAGKHGLRALDSIHLATMIDLKGSTAIRGVRFVSLSSDKDLCGVSSEEGLEIINPEDEDEALKKLKPAIG